MPSLELSLSPQQFQRLPRNPAYRYSYLDGAAWLSPRPRYYHALLDLRSFAADGAAGVPVRPFRAADWDALPEPFAAAFRDQQPFCGLDDEQRREAARRSLGQTRRGGDGPWVEPASFVAEDQGQGPVGALLTTLLPPSDLTDWDSFRWAEPPPPDCLARRLGRPHLTWVFVAPSHAGRGGGTALLGAAAAALLDLGYYDLATTFLVGNDSSMLWHWRAGFRLLPHPGSRRR
jgi:GNAT superfamily N-acetyltransferase